MTFGLGVQHFKRQQQLLAGFGLAAWAMLASAGEFVIAQVAPFTGPVATEAAEFNAGIRLAFKAANVAGGIHGRQVVLRRLDD